MKPNTKKEKKESMSIGDRATYFYIKKFKKWMFCPACKKGKMRLNKNTSQWTCEDCEYHFSEEYFLNDCVFWFCDECETYLNNQEGFNRKASKHICRKCGYENDISFDNIKGICSDCGKVLPNPDATLCEDCRQTRLKKAKQWLITAGKVVGTVATVAGVAYLAAQANDSDESTEYMPLSDAEDNKEGEAVVDTWHNNVDGIVETEYCQGCIHHAVYPIDGKTHEVCNIWGRDCCYSGCDRKETTPRFRWTDANRWEKD